MFFDRTATNRLKLPKSFKKIPDIDITGLTTNWAGQPVAKVGDFVHFSSGVSAGTIGVVTSLEDLGSGGRDLGNKPKVWLGAKITALSGEKDSAWLWSCLVIPKEAVQEVIDFYMADNRPQRIKFNPLIP